MKNDLENIFKEPIKNFDNKEPNIGHFERFEAKLKAQNEQEKKSKTKNWYWLSVAASVLLLIGFLLGNIGNEAGTQLADISPKMKETQNFYVATIRKEIEQIQKTRTSENQKIIDDAFTQLDVLDKNHQKLTIELKESHEDKRVIFAIIANFQMQIEILQNLVDQIEEFESLQKSNQEENKI